MIIYKLISLVKYAIGPLKTPQIINDLVGPFWLNSDILIDSIELIGNDSFRLNIWTEDYEIQIPSDKVTNKEMEHLIKQIEEILFN